MAEAGLMEPYNKDFAPARVCDCGHNDSLHMMDKTKKRCSVSTGEHSEPCGCKDYTLARFEWTVRGKIVETVEVWRGD